MILVRSPLRISFVGGGTDFADVYTRLGGSVISTAIDKYIYIALHHTPLVPKISVRYSITETVSRPEDLAHHRIKAALLKFGIHKNIEIGSFASLPAETGLGSSSSFTVALIHGLHSFTNNKISTETIAKEACELEIDTLGNPIGKQDQYASAFGGFNKIKFLKDHTVEVTPVKINSNFQKKLVNHLLIFFTGTRRQASHVLEEQKNNIPTHLDLYKKILRTVDDFEKAINKEDIRKIAQIIDDSWKIKREFASTVTNESLDSLYEKGKKLGAWGGKVLGAGGGGCILFITPPEKQKNVVEGLQMFAEEHSIPDFLHIPFLFEKHGTQIIHKN